MAYWLGKQPHKQVLVGTIYLIPLVSVDSHYLNPKATFSRLL